MRKVIAVELSFLPLAVALMVDDDLSSSVHLAVIGIVAVCVTLSDALFGQILANTKWIPFCACHTPNEAENLVKAFRRYHTKLFWQWLTSKFCSLIAIVISALFALQRLPYDVVEPRWMIVGVGYWILGVAVIIMIGFVLTYLQAAEEADRVKLKEMNYAYIKNHPELFRPDGSLIQEQLKGLGDGYNSEPTQAETYSGC